VLWSVFCEQRFWQDKPQKSAPIGHDRPAPKGSIRGLVGPDAPDAALDSDIDPQPQTIQASVVMRFTLRADDQLIGAREEPDSTGTPGTSQYSENSVRARSASAVTPPAWALTPPDWS
jgi:hypothetical protein